MLVTRIGVGLRCFLSVIQEVRASLTRTIRRPRWIEQAVMYSIGQPHCFLRSLGDIRTCSGCLTSSHPLRLSSSFCLSISETATSQLLHFSSVSSFFARFSVAIIWPVIATEQHPPLRQRYVARDFVRRQRRRAISELWYTDCPQYPSCDSQEIPWYHLQVARERRE